MNDNDKRVLQTVIAGVVAVVAVVAGAITTNEVLEDKDPIPRCAPYDVIKGSGTFYDGKWEHYECQPIVSITPEEGTS